MVLLAVSLGALAYVYGGYRLLLRLLVWVRGPQPVQKRDISPSVSVVISAYNEAGVIRRKLENTLALDYPADRLEVVVVSDASTDGTDEIVAEHAPRVRLHRQEVRRGKTAGLNEVLPTLRGEIVVFSDANAIYDAKAVRRLVRNFGDPCVGCVTGESRYVGGQQTGAGAGERAYWAYEMTLKRLETDVGSMVGGDGAIYAIRRSLWTPLPPTAINDFLNPLQVVAAGWRAVYEPEAFCFEAPTASVRKEYRRRIRIVSRSWRAVFQAPAVLNPFRVGFFAVSVFSHKMMRWLAGIFIMGAAVSGASALAPLAVEIRGLPLTAQVFLAVGIVGFCLLSRIPVLMAYFVVLQMAGLVGVVYGSVGRVAATWTPPREPSSTTSRRGRWEPGLIAMTATLAVVGLVWVAWFAAAPRQAALAMFWGAVVALAYVYVGYPLVLTGLRVVFRRSTGTAELEPSVCLFVTANDEETVITEKIRNALALDYPRDRLQIVVASDGSRDRTNEIVESFAGAGVRLLAFPERRGKMAAINAGMSLVGDVDLVVFSDANTMLSPDALRCLVRRFHDESVGAVSGNVTLVGERASLAAAEDLYYRYERWLQEGESEIGSMVGVDGALYAVRRRLFRPPPDDTILDDVSIPMEVVRQGYRVVLERGATAWEPGSRSAADEMLRKSRVVAGAVQFVARGSQMPRRPLQIVFSLVSHKILRWLSPALVLSALGASLWLAPTGTVYRAAALAQLALFGVGVLGCVRAVRKVPLVGLAHYFFLVHLAAGLGLVRGLAGRQPVAWKRFARLPIQAAR